MHQNVVQSKSTRSTQWSEDQPFLTGWVLKNFANQMYLPGSVFYFSAHTSEVWVKALKSGVGVQSTALVG